MKSVQIINCNFYWISYIWVLPKVFLLASHLLIFTISNLCGLMTATFYMCRSSCSALWPYHLLITYDATWMPYYYTSHATLPATTTITTTQAAALWPRCSISRGSPAQVQSNSNKWKIRYPNTAPAPPHNKIRCCCWWWCKPHLLSLPNKIKHSICY